MKKKPIEAVIAASLSAAIFSGCITSRSPDCTAYDKNLANGKQKKSISFSFLRSASPNQYFSPSSPLVPMQGAWATPQPSDAALYQFKTVFEDSAASFSSFTESTGSDSEIKMTINQQNGFNPLSGIPAFFSGATLLLMPCWADDVYYLSVKAENKKGLKKEYLIRRDVTTTAWLPFIFAMPFSDMPWTARDKITLENWKELKSRMEMDGFFDAEKR